MVNAIQVRGHHQQQQHQAAQGRRNRVAAGPAAELIDTSAQQQVAALGALVAMLLQLQVRRALTVSGASARACMRKTAACVHEHGIFGVLTWHILLDTRPTYALMFWLFVTYCQVPLMCETCSVLLAG
jgi:hypothetical protein